MLMEKANKTNAEALVSLAFSASCGRRTKGTCTDRSSVFNRDCAAEGGGSTPSGHIYFPQTKNKAPRCYQHHGAQPVGRNLTDSVSVTIHAHVKALAQERQGRNADVPKCRRVIVARDQPNGSANSRIQIGSFSASAVSAAERHSANPSR